MTKKWGNQCTIIVCSFRHRRCYRLQFLSPSSALFVIIVVFVVSNSHSLRRHRLYFLSSLLSSSAVFVVYVCRIFVAVFCCKLQISLSQSSAFFVLFSFCCRVVVVCAVIVVVCSFCPCICLQFNKLQHLLSSPPHCRCLLPSSSCLIFPN